MHVAAPDKPIGWDVNDEHASDRPLLQFLRFSVGPDAYAVRIELVREILEVAQMTPLPLMPAFVRGVMRRAKSSAWKRQSGACSRRNTGFTRIAVKVLW